MNRLLTLATLPLVVAGCAAIDPVRPPQADGAAQAVEAVAGGAGAQGCRPAPEIQVTGGLTLEEQREARRPIRRPTIRIRSLDGATLASARAEGFQGRAPAETNGLSVREIRRAGDTLLIYMSSADIADGDTIRDVLLAGGALLSEMPRDAGFAAFMAEQLGDEVVAIKIGPNDGSIRRRHEIASGVRPYEIRWQDGGSYFLLTTAAPSAAAAVDQARSVMC